MFRPILHLGLHFIVPGVVSRLLFPDRWKTAWMLMMSAIIMVGYRDPTPTDRAVLKVGGSPVKHYFFVISENKGGRSRLNMLRI